ncbi:MAG: glutathione S-transferase family protein [Cyanobacteria bacterium P01_F01_bin.3]
MSSSAENPQLSLYGGPQTRATLVQWYLEELEIPYSYIALNLQANEQQQPEYLAINPMGKVPAVVDGDVKIWESGAILLYLAEKVGAVSDSAAGRAEMSQWVIFANATLGTSLFLPDRRDREAPRLLKPLDEILTERPYIVGAELTAADIAVGSYLFYSTVMFSFDLSPYPTVDAYVKRLMARPAFQKTMGQR